MNAPDAPATGMRADETLDDLRVRLAPLIATNAGFDGWSPKAVAMAAQQAGVDNDLAALAFQHGAMSMITAWFASIDAAMLARFTPEELAAMKIRERITALVEARLTLLAPHREPLRRAQAILAMPRHVSEGVRLGWHAADVMWRAAGDTAVDYNHYTKRATLGSVYAATLLTFINDESENFADTRAFLARRIEGIMRFEKAKARLVAGSDMHFSPARFLGRLRYRASHG
jgi:ubiquinone biosynthesis protein COQ9